MSTRPRKALGEILIEQNLVTKSQLDHAIAEKQKGNESLLHVLIKLKFVDPEALRQLYEQEFGILKISLQERKFEQVIIKLVPEEFCRKYEVVPISRSGDVVTVGMVNPLDILTIDRLRLMLKCEIEPVLVSETDAHEFFTRYFGLGEVVEESADGISQDAERLEKWEEVSAKEIEDVDVATLQTLAGDIPIIKLVNIIVSRALNEGASDIHIEPSPDKVAIRLRIDGILRPVASPAKKLHAAIISRIKILSAMDIAECRLPQDGRYSVKIKDRSVDLRVSCIPTVDGEKIVIRLLDAGQVILELPRLGFSPAMLKTYKSVIHKPWGIILVSGPTGSGKTTTLYSSLSTIKTSAKNIVTIEDPVEYRLGEIIQTQVNVKAGLTFARGLRAFLRQDPDIMMVGEIRDPETAEIAVHAAMTGHLVFSTIHTNDAASAFPRLIDMGIQPFLVTSTVLCVIAQRLARCICANCKMEYVPDADMVKAMKLDQVMTTNKLFKGKGCEKCRQSGYKGRVGLYELLIANQEIKELVKEKAPGHVIREAARKNGMITMYEDGLDKIVKGITTIEELVALTQQEE